MPGTVYLHVGPHKTGSTYIQRRFMENADALKSVGFLYPSAGRMFFGHHGMVHRLRNTAPQFHPSEDEIAALASVPEDVVLSSENFTRCEAPELDTLKGWFPGARFRVVFVYRDPLRTLPAYHASRIGEGVTLPIADFFADLERSERLSVNAAIQLDKFTGYFGRENVSVIDYASVTNNSRDICDVLCERVIGIPPLPASARTRVNETQPPEWIEFVRCLNIIHRMETGSNPAHMMRIGFFKCRHIRDSSDFVQFSEALREATVRIADHPVLSLAAEIRTHVAEHHRDLFIDDPVFATATDDLATVGQRWWRDTPQEAFVRRAYPEVLAAFKSVSHGR